MLNAGDALPVFPLLRREAPRASWYVVTFYVKASTPSCTTQVCELATLSSPRVQVVALGPGTLDAHERFESTLAATTAPGKRACSLVLDAPQDGAPPLALACGVWGKKKLYGKEQMGVIRSTFVVDQHGIIKHAWHNLRVKGHAAAVRDALKALDSLKAPPPARASVPKRQTI
jgi:peroxiredoxin Q/BCP